MGDRDVTGTGAARWLLLAAQAVVAVCALAAGAFFVVGTLVDGEGGGPPISMLEGSPFTSYLVPGAVLFVVIGGSHALACALGLARRGLFPLVSTIAGYGLLIWIFVQVMIIPFSGLQVLFFAVGLAEVGLVLVILGVFPRSGTAGGNART